MKKIIFATLAAVGLLAASCQDEEDEKKVTISGLQQNSISITGQDVVAGSLVDLTAGSSADVLHVCWDATKADVSGSYSNPQLDEYYGQVSILLMSDTVDGVSRQLTPIYRIKDGGFYVTKARLNSYANRLYPNEKFSEGTVKTIYFAITTQYGPNTQPITETSPQLIKVLPYNLDLAKAYIMQDEITPPLTQLQQIAEMQANVDADSVVSDYTFTTYKYFSGADKKFRFGWPDKELYWKVPNALEPFKLAEYEPLYTDQEMYAATVPNDGLYKITLSLNEPNYYWAYESVTASLVVGEKEYDLMFNENDTTFYTVCTIDDVTVLPYIKFGDKTINLETPEDYEPGVYFVSYNIVSGKTIFKKVVIEAKFVSAEDNSIDINPITFEYFENGVFRSIAETQTSLDCDVAVKNNINNDGFVAYKAVKNNTNNDDFVVYKSPVYGSLRTYYLQYTINGGLVFPHVETPSGEEVYLPYNGDVSVKVGSNAEVVAIEANDNATNPTKNTTIFSTQDGSLDKNSSYSMFYVAPQTTETQEFDNNYFYNFYKSENWKLTKNVIYVFQTDYNDGLLGDTIFLDYDPVTDTYSAENVTLVKDYNLMYQHGDNGEPSSFGFSYGSIRRGGRYTIYNAKFGAELDSLNNLMFSSESEYKAITREGKTFEPKEYQDENGDTKKCILGYITTTDTCSAFIYQDGIYTAQKSTFTDIVGYYMYSYTYSRGDVAGPEFYQLYSNFWTLKMGEEETDVNVKLNKENGKVTAAFDMSSSNDVNDVSLCLSFYYGYQQSMTIVLCKETISTAGSYILTYDISTGEHSIVSTTEDAYIEVKSGTTTKTYPISSPRKSGISGYTCLFYAPENSTISVYKSQGGNAVKSYSVSDLNNNNYCSNYFVFTANSEFEDLQISGGEDNSAYLGVYVGYDNSDSYSYHGFYNKKCRYIKEQKAMLMRDENNNPAWLFMGKELDISFKYLALQSNFENVEDDFNGQEIYEYHNSIEDGSGYTHDYYNAIIWFDMSLQSFNISPFKSIQISVENDGIYTMNYTSESEEDTYAFSLEGSMNIMESTNLKINGINSINEIDENYNEKGDSYFAVDNYSINVSEGIYTMFIKNRSEQSDVLIPYLDSFE